MGFAVGSSFNYPPSHSLFPISSQHFLSHSEFLNFLRRNADNKRKNRVAMACIRHGNPNDTVYCKRRAVLFMSVSILPLLTSRAEAVESLVAEDSAESRTQDKEENVEIRQGAVSANPFLSLINGVGIFGSAVLGALSALAQMEKAATEATMESTKTKLKEKEAAIVSLQKNFEREMQTEKEEQNKQLKKANEERQSLTKQLQSADSTITGLGLELQKENKVVEELEVQIDSLTTNYVKAGEDKEKLEDEMKEKLNLVELLKEKINLLTSEVNDKEDNICNLSSRLAAKELEFKKMSSICENTQNEVAGLNSDIRGLKDGFLKIENDLELKNVVVDDLNVQVNSIRVERDDSNRKFDIIEKEYRELKLSSEKRAISDAKILEERENELHHLKEQLELALNEMSRNEVLVSDLTQKKKKLRKSLDEELERVKNLEQELGITQEALAKSRNEASDLAEKLQESRNSCSQLADEISKIRSKSAEAREWLQTNLVQAKQSAEVLAGEVMSTKEILNRTNEEMQTVPGELAAVARHCESLQKELVDVYKKAESAAHDLKEEKKIVTSLNEELTALESQKMKDKEARKSLETDLEEATKSLDEMNRNTSTLSRDVVLANSQITSLRDEKDLLYKTLVEQKQLYQEARENIEDANNLVMSLGKEKEKMEKKTKKLKEEIASAKGEILRLKCQLTSFKAPVNHVDEPKGVEEGITTVAVKRTTRKKKVASHD